MQKRIGVGIRAARPNQSQQRKTSVADGADELRCCVCAGFHKLGRTERAAEAQCPERVAIDGSRPGVWCGRDNVTVL